MQRNVFMRAGLYGLIVAVSMVLAPIANSAESKLPVKMQAVTATKVEVASSRSWQLTGQIESRFAIPLSFRVGGQVDSKLIEVGQKVSKGETLVTLDKADLTLALKQAQANLSKAQADHQNAVRERNRLSKMYKNKLVSEQDLQRAETAEIAAKQSVLAMQAALDLAQRQLNYSQLKAPASGILTNVDVEAGQVVSAGQPLLTLATGAHEAVVFLPTNRTHADLSQVEVKGVDQPGVCHAALRAKTPINDKVTLQYKAYFTLSDCSQPLPLGAVVELNVKQTLNDLLQVPVSALIDTGNQPRVWLIKDGKVHGVAVKVVSMGAQYAVIEALHTARLPLDSQIVADGVHLLTEGMPVEVVKKEDDSADSGLVEAM
ncbi:efflux RND transporter periplasmic adaptor subunit [Hydrogenovibrio kuenenii]|uniref:efflux RND transporter periplasmic adaptor subunit n=1 Tax=Hydrogenovibrio kuenenii TaxID=63658 RepID=UPI0012FECE39|nr:efflux RND transporter periplasmic adaptor subunit [Hydrogenovibrio kuenenii]